MTRSHRGPLRLRCRAPSSPSPRRFIPAHPQFPHRPPTVPLPLPREIRRRCVSRLFAASMAFAVRDAARLLLVPTNGASVSGRQDSHRVTDRPVASPNGLSTLGSDAGRFLPTPPACYPAPWRLVGPDFHRPVDASLCSGQVTSRHHLRTPGHTNFGLVRGSSRRSIVMRSRPAHFRATCRRCRRAGRPAPAAPP